MLKTLGLSESLVFFSSPLDIFQTHFWYVLNLNSVTTFLLWWLNLKIPTNSDLTYSLFWNLTNLSWVTLLICICFLLFFDILNLVLKLFLNSLVKQIFYVFTFVLIFFQSLLESVKVYTTYFSEFANFILNDFIRNLTLNNLTTKGFFFNEIVLLVFIALLFFNVIGMATYTFSVTSQVIITFFFSFMVYGGINYFALKFQKVLFLNLFLPPGTPLWLAPLLVILEIVSYIARLFSLAIRLFANIMSGHTLTKILSGFIFLIILLQVGNLLGSLSQLLSTSFIFAITVLELGISALQAYVFSVLLLIYLSNFILGH